MANRPCGNRQQSGDVVLNRESHQTVAVRLSGQEVEPLLTHISQKLAPGLGDSSPGRSPVPALTATKRCLPEVRSVIGMTFEPLSVGATLICPRSASPSPVMQRWPSSWVGMQKKSISESSVKRKWGLTSHVLVYLEYFFGSSVFVLI
jgi:hypothetical protein